MRLALHAPLHDTALVNLAAGGFLLFALACALLAPRCSGCCRRPRPPPPSSSSPTASPRLHRGLAVAHLRQPRNDRVDLLGHQPYQPTIALMKGIGIGLAMVAVLRYGPRLDLFNPASPGWRCSWAGWHTAFGPG